MKTRNTLIALIALIGLAATSQLSAQEIGDSTTARIARGDTDKSGTLDERDLKTMLGILFAGQRPAVSGRELDVNRDGRFDIADVDALARILDASPGRSKPAEVSTERVVIGDANDDGKVDIADAVVLGEFLGTGKPPKGPKEACDVNRDGRVDVADLSLMYLSL